MGFDIVDAPEIDTAWYNFDSLRMPEDHPARQNHDSFWLTDGRLLRTHTTNFQLHATEGKKPPLRVMHFGNCYRHDATDATHDVVFTQIDCLAIDEGLSMANLISVLDTFLTRIFGTTIKYRFRPHNFPFTEPSIEVDIWHNGKQKWIELLGSGMVHPQVLENMKIDPKIYSGFAFGIGIERIAMAKWDIEDLRHFRTNKHSFLRQFKD
jgi:phenylalanyl-tRNA synthetase alpha chain